MLHSVDKLGNAIHVATDGIPEEDAHSVMQLVGDAL